MNSGTVPKPSGCQVGIFEEFLEQTALAITLRFLLYVPVYKCYNPIFPKTFLPLNEQKKSTYVFKFKQRFQQFVK